MVPPSANATCHAADGSTGNWLVAVRQFSEGRSMCSMTTTSTSVVLGSSFNPSSFSTRELQSDNEDGAKFVIVGRVAAHHPRLVHNAPTRCENRTQRAHC